MFKDISDESDGLLEVKDSRVQASYVALSENFKHSPESAPKDKKTDDSQSQEALDGQDFPADIPQEIAELFARGVHFGHQKAHVHPSMFPFIVSVRNAVHIIDLEQTLQKLGEASRFLTQQTGQGKVILFMGTRLPVRPIVRRMAEACGMPFIVERWSGGTLTNWKTISLRIDHLRELEAKKKSDEWNKYTKYERAEMDKEISKLEKQWGGIRDLKRVPDILLLVDMHHDHIAVKEANILNIPVVAIADTNVNVKLAAYPIPASDDSLASVEYILGKLKDAIVEGRQGVVVAHKEEIKNNS